MKRCQYPSCTDAAVTSIQHPDAGVDFGRIGTINLCKIHALKVKEELEEEDLEEEDLRYWLSRSR